MRKHTPTEVRYSDKCEVVPGTFFAHCRETSGVVRAQFKSYRGKHGFPALRLRMQGANFAMIRTRQELNGGLILARLAKQVLRATHSFILVEANSWVSRIEDDFVSFELCFLQVWRDGRMIATRPESELRLSPPMFFTGDQFGFDLKDQPWVDQPMLQKKYKN